MNPPDAIATLSSVPVVRPVQKSVPPTLRERRRVMSAARAQVAQMRLVPPIPLEELRGHAREALAKAVDKAVGDEVTLDIALEAVAKK